MNRDTIRDIYLEHIDRTNKHINLVKKYGQKIGKDYSEHDKDKIDDKNISMPYMFLNYKYKHKDFEIPDIMKDLLDKATALHVLNNEHHPEYWAPNKETILKTFKRNNPVMNINCTKMDKDAIDEMCCDWCAMSEEFNNSPIEWADKVVNKRWLFTDKQKEYIYKMLDKLWSEHE